MSSVDNLLQQLDKRSAERVCFQDPSQPHGDPVVVTRNLLHDYSSKQFLKTSESVNSCEFLNNEKSQTLNFLKEGVDVNRIKSNGSVDVESVGIPSVKKNQIKSDINSGTRPAKLEKQDCVDFENVSSSELADHLPALSTLRSTLSGQKADTLTTSGSTLSGQQADTLSTSGSILFGQQTDTLTTLGSTLSGQKADALSVSSSNLSDQKTDTAVVEQNLLSNFGNVSEPIQSDVGNLESTSPDISNFELLHPENNDSSAVLGSSKLRFSDPEIAGWKLDGGDSGQLYWRRDSSTLNGIDPSSRVKFRYDVEVCEFESRFSDTEDLLEEDEEDTEDSVNWDSDQEMLLKTCEDSSDASSSIPSSILYFFAAFAIVISLVYGWLTYLFFNEHVEQTH